MNLIRFSWIVSLIATMGSLYYSEILNYEPCKLCWFSRILMYPLVLILGTAILKEDKKIYHYVLPLTITGMFVSGYHYVIQRLSAITKIATPCGEGVPCTTQYINWFDFVTIPFQAFTAFTIITISMIILLKRQRKVNNNE